MKVSLNVAQKIVTNKHPEFKHIKNDISPEKFHNRITSTYKNLFDGKLYAFEYGYANHGQDVFIFSIDYDKMVELNEIGEI